MVFRRKGELWKKYKSIWHIVGFLGWISLIRFRIILQFLKTEDAGLKSTPYRRLNISIFHNIKQRHHQKDGTIQHKTVMDKRQIWCEGTFAAQTSRPNLGFLYRRGIKAAEDHGLMSATALNIKRMVNNLA